MQNTNQKFGTLVETLQNLVATGNFVLDVQRNVTSTSYRTGSLEMALQRQVIEETVHQLGQEEDEQPQAPKRRIKIQILGLDNEQTILRKIEIAQDMFNGTFAEMTPGEVLRRSDRLIDVMDGFFGTGPELDRQYQEQKENEAIGKAEVDAPSSEQIQEVLEENSENVTQELPQTPYANGVDESNPAQNDSTGLENEPNTSSEESTTN